MENAEIIINRIEQLINEDNSFGTYEEYTKLIENTYQEGCNDGSYTAKCKIAKKMLKDDFDIKYIHRITNLEINDIINLVV